MMKMHWYDWAFWALIILLGIWKFIELSDRFGEWLSNKAIDLIKRRTRHD